MNRIALITGITGQDGSYLAELLLNEGWSVHGIVRRTSSPSTSRIAHILPRLHLHEGDASDGGSLERIVRDVEPGEVYNLAAQSHVGASFKTPLATIDVVALGAARLLEAVRRAAPEAAFYQASSSEMFGDSPPPQSEATPFRPRSPYAVAKCAAHWQAVMCREAYGMRVSCGILMNHESPRRGEEFVTRKVTLAAARIRKALKRSEAPPKLKLGNLDAKRDWGHARDYMDAARRMLRAPSPGDYVIATGEAHSVREFVEAAFAWHADDGCAAMREWREHVELDPAMTRPADVPDLCGDASKAERDLGWIPTVTFRGLVEDMARSDWEAARR